MKPIIRRYPLDPTGTSSNNYVLGEVRDIGTNPRRAIAPYSGHFYSKSMTVIDLMSQKTLVRDKQYFVTELNPKATAELWKEVFAIVVITDKTVSDRISLNYQAVGGEYSSFTDTINRLIENISIDDRPVLWSSISDKPTAFTPAKHLHDIGDAYNFTECTVLVDYIRNMILYQDVLSHDPIYQYIDTTLASFSAEITALLALIVQHINDTNNPHRVTAGQITAYIRSEFDSRLNAITTLLDNNITTATSALAAHIANINNPHQTTAGQTGAYTAAEMEAAFQAAILATPGGGDGYWEYRYGSYAYSYSDTNEFGSAVLWSITSQSSGDRREACRIYVNGATIAPAFNYHTKDPKFVQGLAWVPAGGSIYVDLNTGETPCRALAYRFRPF